MKTAHDLFLSEDARDQKARRSVAEILVEDDADLKRLAELAETSIIYKKLSRLKSSCAWLMLHKRSTVAAFSAVTVSLAALFFVPSLIADNANEQVIATGADVQPEPKANEKVATAVVLPDVSKAEVPVKETNDALETYAQMEVAKKEPSLGGDLLILPPPVLTPITEAQVREQLDKTPAKVPIAPPTVVGAVAVPLNQVNIHEEAVTPDKTASDIIDQFGFGTEPKDNVPAATAEESKEGGEEIVPAGIVPVPAAKPQEGKAESEAEIKDVRYQIIDRDGERAGFRRMKEKDPETTQWFLVIEALDGAGKAISMPVMSMDTGEVKLVTKWAIQVPENDFMKFADEKKKSGKIANTVIGTAPSNKTEPKWSVKLTGNMLTEWE
jgi:hypothetical protein